MRPKTQLPWPRPSNEISQPSPSSAERGESDGRVATERGEPPSPWRDEEKEVAVFWLRLSSQPRPIPQRSRLYLRRAQLCPEVAMARPQEEVIWREGQEVRSAGVRGRSRGEKGISNRDRRGAAGQRGHLREPGPTPSLVQVSCLAARA